MAKRKLENKLINKDDIQEEIKLIDETDIEYITRSGKVYTYYGDNKYLPKRTFINKNNGYLYVNLNGSNGKMITRRVHRLVAIAFIPNPENLPVVMHIDNDKANPVVTNLKWGTHQENTQDAFDDGLAKNDKGFHDSQSFPVAQFDLDFVFIKSFGSASIAAKKTGMTVTGILYQCYHRATRKPKKGFYYRFLDEYKEKGFVL